MGRHLTKRGWPRRPAAYVLVGIALAGLAVLPTEGDQVDVRAGSSPSQDATIELLSVAGPNLRVVGWVRAESERPVAVTTGGQRVVVVAQQRRYDVAAATGGRAGWGFEATLEATDDPRVCVEVEGVVSDCAWSGCTQRLFPKSFRRRLEAGFGAQRFSAHVTDDRTGCSYALNEGLVITTASVVKVEILAGILLQAQRDDRDLTASERNLAESMMHFSLNPETSALWSQVGGVGGLRALDTRFGLTATTHLQPFGATRSTAEDMNKVTAALLAGGGPLDWPGVESAWEIMRGVHRTQQWGVSADVSVGFEVANKNGFFPLTGSGWRVGSTGYVADPDGGGYAITVLTDRNETQAEGVALVEAIASRVNQVLTFGPVADRPWDEVECITNTGVGGSWTALTQELGLPASDSAQVRRAAGGDGPLRGQSICTP